MNTFKRASQVVPVVKNPPANAGGARDAGSIPGLGRSPGERNGNQLQYSCLENPYGQRSLPGYSPWVTKSQTRLSTDSSITYRYIIQADAYGSNIFFMVLMLLSIGAPRGDIHSVDHPVVD